MRSRQTLSGGLVMLLLLFLGWSSLPLNAQNQTVTVTIDGEPPTIVVDETAFTINIALSGVSTNCPTPPITQPVDAALVIDVSTSMNEQDGLPDTRLAYARQAAELFVQALTLDLAPERGGDQVAIVTFSNGASELVPLSQNQTQLLNSVRGLALQGGTNIAAGLQQGTDTLLNFNTQNTAASRVIVLLSDGDSNAGSAILAAERARSAGVRVITVAVGTTASTDLLLALADSPSDFYNEPNASNLPVSFQRIADLIQLSIAARDLQFTYTFDNTRFELVPAGITPPPVSTTANSVTWSLGELNNADTADFQMQLRSNQIFNQTSVGQLTGTYLLCDTNTQEVFTATGPVVSIVSPSPTPTSTHTYTPLPSPTPLPTATPTQPSIAIGSFVPSPPSTPAISTILDFCVGGLGGLVPILLALLLLALALLWAFWHYRRHRAGRCSALCLVLWTTFGFYTALALWLFALPFIGTLCAPQESVYFWRQDPSNGYTGIYVTAPNASTNASFNALNTNGCVGCHTVSQTTERVAAILGSPPGDLLIYDFDGTRLPIPVNIDAFYAAFSPDGQRLVYVSANVDLRILDLQTGIDTPLAGASDPTQAETMPSWGPNGQIAFVRPVNNASMISGYAINGPSDIYVVSENGGTATLLLGASGDGFNYYPSFSPDGRWLSFTHHNNTTTYSDPQALIYIVPATGGQPIEIVANRDENGNSIPGAANSWSSWSRDGSQLAFNSQRNDSNYDIFTTTITESGNSTVAVPLTSASQAGVFEHLPFWGLPIATVDLGTQLPGLLPFLLPIPLLALLAWANCQTRTPDTIPQPSQPVVLPPPPPPDPLKLPPLIPPWQPQPSLIIGLGESGRWILTHLKKSFLDAGLGKVPDGIQLVALDMGDWQQLENQASPVQFAGVHLTREEVIELNDNLSDDLRRLRDTETVDPQLRRWMDREIAATLLARYQEQTDLRNGAKGQRVLARFGLLKHLREAPADTNFFDRLRTSAATVLSAQAAQLTKRGLSDDRRLNIIVIGDTYGDISSSALFDAALLAREAGRQNGAKGYRVSAHIMTDQVRQEISQNRESDQVNTGATLREIARYQLADARAFPIRYQQIADDRCDYLPFDEFVVYDGSGRNLRQPQLTVYPAIADAIALWLDSVVRQDNDVRDLQSAEKNKISQGQGETDQVHIISQGIFTYRLPFADLIEVIQYRFQQEIFRAFIMGRSLNETNVRLDESLNGETFGRQSSTSESVANDFLTGKLLASNETRALNVMQALDYLLNQRNPKDALAALRRSETIKEDLFAQLLSPLVALLLNGQAVTIKTDIFSARGGKIGFVLAFLKQVQRLSKDLQEQLGAIQEVTDKRDALHKALERLIVTAQSAELNLSEQAQALGVIAGIDKNLRERVLPRLTALDERQQQMGSIDGVRQYLWRDAQDEPLERVWYNRYLVPPSQDRTISPDADKRQAALAQLYWEVAPTDADGDIKIQLALVGEKGRTRLDITSEAIEAFDLALIDLASRYCAPIITGQTLAQTLSETLFNEDSTRATVQTLVEQSSIQISPLKDTAYQNAVLNVVISGNTTVDLSAVEQAISTQSGKEEGEGYLRLNVTDPYSISVNRRLAAIPLEGVTSLDNARRTYRRNHNLINEPNSRKNPNPIPTSVYESEAEALMLEAQYREKLRENPELLHPVVVTSFADEPRARAFYLALAAGELETRKVRGSDHYALYYTGGSQPKEFPPARTGEHPLIAGLMTILMDNNVFPTTEIVAMIERYRTDDDISVIFEDWQKRGWRAWVEELDNYDERSSKIVMDILRVSRLLADRYRA